MAHGITNVPPPRNEPIRAYAPGSRERDSLKAQLDLQLKKTVDIPAVIGGKEVRTGRTLDTVCPHDHGHVLGTQHLCGPEQVEQAITAAREAWPVWSELDWEERAAVFLKAADLLAGPWRDRINAATMLNQSKTVFQAEIDSACELIDFWRFNPSYAREIFTEQPQSPPGIWDRAEFRALEGFIFAVTPFNFTSIALNLPTSAALMGNTVLWKPAPTNVLPCYLLLKLLEEAGLPPGVINFLPGEGADVGDTVMSSPELAGLHFTGSTATFHHLWKTVGDNIGRYRSYPRIVGETGGKDFVFAHPSADPASLAAALVRGAFEFQGQKCSAASRAYIPKSLWPDLRERMVSLVDSIDMGSPLDFRNFMAAVIDAKSFKKISGYINEAKEDAGYELVCGGGCDDSTGYFIEPTIVRAEQPDARLLREEIFGPVLTVYVYDDAKVDETADICNSTSPYGLTGAIFARDRVAIQSLTRRLRHAAGNFYVNDKPTGAVVGQQPFGGGRKSGTNDKAGSKLNLLRWMSQRSIKETFVPPTTIGYPHMGAE